MAGHRDLKVYQLAYRLAMRIFEIRMRTAKRLKRKSGWTLPGTAVTSRFRSTKT